MDGPVFERPPLRPKKEEAATPRTSSARPRKTTRGKDRPRRTASRPARPVREPRPAAPKPKRRTGRLVLLVLLLLLVAASVAGCAAYADIAKSLPDPSKPMLGRDQTSRILDRNGNQIAELYASQNRTNVKLAEIPKDLRNAVVATEDERYYQHPGVDVWGTARALWTDIVQGRKAQGGSTITQQYVKNAFTNQERTLKRKVMEAMLAYRVEQRYSKDQILEMYLNTIYFGHGAYGIERASEVYFGKPVGQLDTAECAMIAGVIKSPGRYSPRIDPAAAKKRRHTVLTQMRTQGYIDGATFAEADAAGFKLATAKKDSTAAPYFVEYVKTALVEKFGADLVYKGGLTVRTTLDMKMQRAAEEAVSETLDRKGDPSAALVAIDPATGEVRAMVGGTDFATQQYNVAAQGHRQPGSAFKPFVLAAALKNGVSPEQTFESGPVELTPKGASTPWRVTGAGGDRSGPMRLREATERSVNSVYAQLILQIGADKVVDVAKAMGITSPVEAVPAIALGGLETGVSPLEMASAYGTFADKGVHVPAHGVIEVKDPSGKVLMTGSTKGTRAISEAIAYLATDILKGVIDGGTGTGADIGRPAAGKTGTTQAYRDAWFAGYTPNLAAAVWVGYPDAAREMTSVHGRKVTGGSFPADIWAKFMKAALAGTSKPDFVEPADGLTSDTICLDTGLLATEYCPRTGEGLFLADALPKHCDVHTEPQQVAVPDVSGMSSAAAQAALEKAGFKMAVSSSGGTTGTVVSQTPKAGTKAKQGSTVTVRLSGGGGGGGGASAKVSASFLIEPSGDMTFAFDASGSKGTSPLRFEWDFGDGSTATGTNVTHTFARKGEHVVTLRLTDGTGATSSTAQRVLVK